MANRNVHVDSRKHSLERSLLLAMVCTTLAMSPALASATNKDAKTCPDNHILVLCERDQGQGTHPVTLPFQQVDLDSVIHLHLDRNKLECYASKAFGSDALPSAIADYSAFRKTVQDATNELPLNVGVPSNETAKKERHDNLVRAIGALKERWKTDQFQASLTLIHDNASDDDAMALLQTAIIKERERLKTAVSEAKAQDSFTVEIKATLSNSKGDTDLSVPGFNSTTEATYVPGDRWEMTPPSPEPSASGSTTSATARQMATGAPSQTPEGSDSVAGLIPDLSDTRGAYMGNTDTDLDFNHAGHRSTDDLARLQLWGTRKGQRSILIETRTMRLYPMLSHFETGLGFVMMNNPDYVAPSPNSGASAASTASTQATANTDTSTANNPSTASGSNSSSGAAWIPAPAFNVLLKWGFHQTTDGSGWSWLNVPVAAWNDIVRPGFGLSMVLPGLGSDKPSVAAGPAVSLFHDAFLWGGYYDFRVGRWQMFVGTQLPITKLINTK